MMLDDAQNEIDAAIMEMPPERKVLALQRACKKVGVAHAYDEDGVLHVESDENDDDLMDAYGQELINMIFDDALHELHDNGLIEIQPDEDGELTYKLTDEGKKEAEKIYEDENEE